MKEKIKRISSSTWALILAVMMILSSFSVLAATTNAEKTGAYTGTIYYHNSSISGDVYIYSYGGNITFGEWDTTKMTSLGDGYYSIEVPSTNTDTNVIFHPKNGSQTGNLTYPTNSNNLYDDDTDSWKTYDVTPSEHDVYIYGDVNSEYQHWSGFGDILDQTPKFTYDSDNHKFVLNDLLMDLAETKFRIYDKTTSTHYKGTSNITTLTSGVQADMVENSTWSTDNYFFLYIGETSKYVNIEITDDFKYITVTDAKTLEPIASSVTLSADSATKYTGDSVTLTATVTDPLATNLNYTFTEVGTTKSKTVSSTDTSVSTSFSSLTKGTHKYMVEVSADGYTTVSSTEVTVTVTDAPTGDGFYLYNYDGNGDHTFAASTSLGEFFSGELTLNLDSSTTYYLYVVKDKKEANCYFNNSRKFSETTHSVKLYDYGTNNFDDAIKFTPSVSGEYKFIWETGTDNVLSYELMTKPVATSVSLEADSTTKYIGDSVTLTATAIDAVEGYVTYAFTEVNTGETQVQTSSTGSVSITIDNLEEGVYKYKVEASADGCTSVSSEEVIVTVTEKPVATTVTLSSNASGEIVKYGEDITLTAVAEDKVEGEVTYTFERIDDTSSETLTTIKTAESNAAYVLSGLKSGTYTYRVTVSADGCSSVTSNTLTITVQAIDVATTVNLNGPIAGNTYYVGDSVKLTASCEGSETSSITYIYYINGKQINSTATPNAVTYKFTSADIVDGKAEFKVRAIADGYLAVESDITTVNLVKKQVATSVDLVASPSTVKEGVAVNLTATLKGDVQSGEFTYTFTDDDCFTQTANSNNGVATILVRDLTVGEHDFKVVVSDDDYASVEATAKVTVVETYATETVGVQSDKTMLISYDKTNANNSSKVRDYVHVWHESSNAIVDGSTAAGKMDNFSSIPGLYYKDLTAFNKSFSTHSICFIVKHGAGWDTNSSGDQTPSGFKAGVQWYVLSDNTNKQYTPLGIDTLKYPAEINDDASTNFELTVSGGLPYFFGKTLNSANDNAVYTVTITDPSGNVVGEAKTAKYGSETVKFTGLNLTEDGDYTFTVTDGIDTVSYTKNLTIEPLVQITHKATVNECANANVSVVYKDTSIADGTVGDLPENKIATIYVTDIKDGYKIKNVTVKTESGDVAVTKSKYGEYVFTIPTEDMTIDVEIVEKSKYAVNYGVNNDEYGTISAQYGDTSIKSGARVTEGTEVTFTVTTTSDYVIEGWYSDASFSSKISGASGSTYTTTISDTINVYVKINEDPGTLTSYRLYYGSDENPQNWTTYMEVYQKANGTLVATVPSSIIVDKAKYYFGLFKNSNINSASNMCWSSSSCSTTITSTETSYVSVDAKKEYYVGNQRYGNYGDFYIQKSKGIIDLTIVMSDPSKDSTNGSYTITPIVKKAPTGAVTVYAKDGTLKTTNGYGDTTVDGMSASCATFIEENSNYNVYAAMPGDRLTVTTVVNDAQDELGWYVSNYVINGVGYDATETVKSRAVETRDGTITGASYTITTPYLVGNENIEITPIYKNKNIEAANDYITLYVDAKSLGDRWGNTISVYSYYYQNGSVSGTTKHMNSAYPGEPMMKTSSGLYVAYVPRNAWGTNSSGEFVKLDNYEVSGVTFNNYKEDESIHQKFLTTAQNKNFQSYDYDDFKYIAAAGYDTVLYEFHYRKASTSNQKSILNNSTSHGNKSGTSIDVSAYANTTTHNGWDNLTNMDGEDVSLLGYTEKTVPTGETFDNTNKLHIVSVGNQNTTMGKWSTIWYVYDKDGNYVTQGLPSDFIPRYTADSYGNLQKGEESSSQSDAYNDIIDKGYSFTGAYITYENEMDATTSTEPSNSGIRSDGRWYYSRAVEQVKLTTHVLYADDKTSTSWTEDNYGSDNAGTYTGAKALVGSERNTTVDRNTEVSITASAVSSGTSEREYKFIGWTTDISKNDDGTFNPTINSSMIESSQTVKVSTNMDVYALYIPVAEGDLVITHEAYTGEGAFGGSGRYFVQATIYDENDNVIETLYQEDSVTIEDYTENSGKIEVELLVYSVNGSKYQATYNYKFEEITDQTHVGKVCSAINPAVVDRTIYASDIFDNGVMKTNKVDFYSDLKSNNITVKMNYYNRKVVNGQPADLDDSPTSYSYKFTSYPTSVYDESGNLSIPALIAYAQQNTQTPSSMIEDYISWSSQADALEGIVRYTNYHTNANYEATPYHTDKYGNVQSSGEKWVTYYDSNGTEISEAKASADTVSSISIWYFNTPKKYTYTMYSAEQASDLTQNGDIYYGTVSNTATDLFYNTRLFTSDREVSDANSPYTSGYGLTEGYTGQEINTAETIDNNGTTLKFLCWAYDQTGKNIASTNIQYGLRITNNTTLYAIYGVDGSEVKTPGLTVGAVTPDTYFDSNNVSKTRINTLFNPYNCPDNDKNIYDVAIVYLRVSNETTADSLDSLTAEQIAELRKNISTVISKAAYEKYKSGTVDPESSAAIVNITGSTASGFKFKVVDTIDESSDQLQTTLTNKNRGQFTTTFSTSTLKGYTYYAFATMGYTNYNGNDETVVTKSIDGADVAYITSSNFVKYSFDANGSYIEG